MRRFSLSTRTLSADFPAIASIVYQSLWRMGAGPSSLMGTAYTLAGEKKISSAKERTRGVRF